MRICPSTLAALIGPWGLAMGGPAAPLCAPGVGDALRHSSVFSWLRRPRRVDVTCKSGADVHAWLQALVQRQPCSRLGIPSMVKL